MLNNSTTQSTSATNSNVYMGTTTSGVGPLMTFNHTGGTYTVTGTIQLTRSQFVIGTEFFSGDVLYHLNGGTLVNNDMQVGFLANRTGYFTATSGLAQLVAMIVRNGVVTLNGGTLQLSQGLSYGGSGTATLNLNGGLLRAGGATPALISGLTAAYVQSGGAKVDTNGFDATLPQALLHDPGLGGTADGGLLKTGTGILTLTGANTFTGQATVNAGTLQIGNGGTSGALAGPLAVTSAAIFNRSDNVTYAGLIQGGGSVTKLGAGVLDLSAISSGFNGFLIANGGQLTISGYMGNAGSTTAGPGATIRTAGTDFNRIGANLTVQPGGTIHVANPIANAHTHAVLNLDGGTMTASGPESVHNWSSTTAAPPTITVYGNFVLNGFGGSGPAATVNVTQTTGTPSLYHNAVIQLNGRANFNVGTGAQLTIAGDLNPPAGLTAAPPILTDFSYTGTYVNVGVLTKSGPGTLILSANSSYSGGTELNGGVLRVQNTVGSATGTGAIVVANTATFGGNGRVTGATTIQTGGTLAPGTAVVGTLTTGNLTLAAGSKGTFKFKAGANDFVSVTPNNGLTLSGGSLTLLQEGTANAFTTPGAYDLFGYVGTLGGAATNLSVANPQAGLTYVFSNDNARKRVVLTVTGTAAAITSVNNATFQTGVAGSFTFTTSGAPAATLTRSGALPTGVTFTDNGNGTATLAGAAVVGSFGIFPLTIGASNGVGSPASQNFTLTVRQAPVLTSAAGATFQTGAAGSFTVTTAAFPTATLARSGALPSGVTFVDNLDGTATLAGTPANGAGGAYPLTFTAANGVGSNGSQNFTLTVQDVTPPTVSGVQIDLGTPDLLANTWASGGTLGIGRTQQTATRLANGKVLVVGGLDLAGVALASAEIFDPATGTWSATGSLVTARYRHASFLLPDGRVLVSGGGSAGGSLDSAETYDPATGLWTATGPMPIAREGHVATTWFPDGPGATAVMFGGVSNGSPIIEMTTVVFNAADDTWSVGGLFSGSELLARSGHTATILAANPSSGFHRVLFTGGTNGSPLASAVLFVPPGPPAPPGPRLIGTGSMANARVGHTATLLPNGKILVVGGSDAAPLASAELYDPATGAWSPTGSLGTPRTAHTATLLPSGDVLVVGGSSDGTNALASAEFYHPSTGTWTPAAPLPGARSQHSAIRLANGDVLLAGGRNAAALLPAAALYRASHLPKVGLGGTIRLRFDVSETGPDPVVTIAGRTADLVRNGNSFTASIVVQAGDPDGPVAFTLSAADGSGNVTATAITLDGSYVVIGIPPVISSVSLRISGGGGPYVRAGKIVNLDYTADEILLTGSGTMAGQAVTANLSGGVSSSAGIIVAAGDPQGPLVFSLTAGDQGGNETTFTATTDGSFVIIDTIAPVVTPPANVTVHATSPTGGVATYGVATADDANGIVELTYSHPSGSTFAVGVTTVVVSATDPAGNVGQATFSVTVTPLTALEDWRYTNFGTAAGAGNAANLADPDGDGLSNLLEFAFGTLPNVSGSGPLQMGGTFAAATLVAPGQPLARAEGADRRALFIRRADYITAGLTYTVQFSANLQTWENSVVTPTSLATSGGLEVVSVPLPPTVGGLPTRFFRVNVDAAP